MQVMYLGNARFGSPVG